MRRFSWSFRALAVGVMSLGSGLAAASPSFDFSLLHEPNVTSGYAAAINSSGDVVGSWPYATLWRNGVAGYLSGAFEISTDVNGLNDVGDAVGSSGDGFGVATVWRNGVASLLTTPQGWTSKATDANNAGHIVGYQAPIGASSERRAVLWQGNTATELPMPAGASASSASAINNLDGIVGWSGSVIRPQATVWLGGDATVLERLGGSISYASDINNLGQIVGSSFLGNGSIYSHAALWQNGTVVDLGVLTGFLNSSANAINDAGWVVGVSSNGNWYEDRATAWINGETIDLNTFLDDDDIAAGWMLSAAIDINQSGVVVGNAVNAFTGMSQIFLLTPAVPEPETWALLLMGLGVAVGTASRHRRP